MGRAAGALAATSVVAAAVVLGVGYLLSIIPETDPKVPLTLYLKVLAITGALGGIVAGVMSNDGKIKWTLPHHENLVFLDMGINGDAVVGITGAWGVLMVLAKSVKFDGADGLLFLVGLGVVAGIGSRKLVEVLTRQLERILTRAEAQDIAKNQASAAGQYAALSSANMAAELFDAAPDQTGRQRLRGVVEKALAYVEPLVATARSADLYIGSAALKKRLAMIAATDEGKGRLLEEAIGLCTRALEVNSDSEVAYYNRSCYRVLRSLMPPRNNDLLRLGLDDLSRAIELDGGNRQLAWGDSDLLALREEPNQRFYGLVGQTLPA